MAKIPATRIRTEYKEGVLNNRLIAGNPLRKEVLASTAGHTIELAHFAPHQRFALDLWRRNEFGTTAWRVIVGRTIAPGEYGQKLPGVHPAAVPLMDVSGATRARAALRWLRDKSDEIDELTEAELVSADMFFNNAPMKRIRTYITAQGGA
ncbi:DUF2840 domain-containing protein (plasmid) [Dyella sp. BiH032]|uniref:DUF2840 domain-containing protein n=1 Tax=Dyella sp. BiH032 TaxID=3075430 RepID=UPI002892ED2C|nr:DUF2840 domain-containing protein [Dyella sp. BiH032]WNL48576.1 DUF2840 domain-containing protein [Dyella sp. BiH032]